MSDPATILINSIPKSGTYLVGKVLEIAGMTPTGYHLRRDRMWNWNEAPDLDTMIRAPDMYRADAGFSETAALIVPGFTYAHLDHTAEVEASLARISGLRHVFLYRNLRDSLVSAMRFRERRKLANGNLAGAQDPPMDRLRMFMASNAALNFVRGAARQKGWLTSGHCLRLRFEDILEPASPALGELLTYCDADDPSQAAALRKRALSSRTRTFSGERSNWRDYWSPEVEAKFGEIGGLSLNSWLGYD